MSVWNRPMFAGTQSARAELERMRVGMVSGGSPTDAVNSPPTVGGYVAGPFNLAVEPPPPVPVPTREVTNWPADPPAPAPTPAPALAAPVVGTLGSAPSSGPAAEEKPNDVDTFLAGIDAQLANAEKSSGGFGGPDSGFAGFAMSADAAAEYLRDAYTARAGVYDEILGDPERRRASARAEILFEIAQRALQFASGVGPDGRAMGGSMFAQAAQSFAPVFGSIAAQSRALGEEEQAGRGARLAAAEKDLAREQDVRAKLDETWVTEQLRGGAESVAPLVLEQFLPSPEDVENHLQTLPNTRLAFDAPSAIKRMANSLTAVFGFQQFPEEGDAIKYMEFFNNRVLGTLARNLQSSGRVSNFVLELSLGLLESPATWGTTPERAIASYTQVRDLVIEDIKNEIALHNQAIIARQPREIMKAAVAIQTLQRTLLEVEAMIEAIRLGRNRAGLPEAGAGTGATDLADWSE